jgi:hypothetical protein
MRRVVVCRACPNRDIPAQLPRTAFGPSVPELDGGTRIWSSADQARKGMGRAPKADTCRTTIDLFLHVIFNRLQTVGNC